MEKNKMNDVDAQIALTKVLLAVRTEEMLDQVGQMVPPAAFFVAAIEHSVGMVAATMLAARKASEKMGAQDAEHHQIVVSMEKAIDELPKVVRAVMQQLETKMAGKNRPSADIFDLPDDFDFPTDAPSE